jgi:ABC-type bacteriocin/lantibiotic exporter with double-glycine peptidase domain
MAKETAIFLTERASYAARLKAHNIVIVNGKIVQQGSYDELKAQNGALS